MLYTIDHATLPSFLITLSHEIESKGAVTISLDPDKDTVEHYRVANAGRSDSIRKDLQQHPQRRSDIITLANRQQVVGR